MSLRPKIFRRLGLILTALALGVAGFILYIIVSHNFHSVSAGQVYRSAQMNGDSLTRSIRENGIKTVINLRGENPGKDWYDAETNAAQQLGVQHFDFSLSASREVSDADMEKILLTMEHAPKPLLLHCKNGADRSGLVAALYLYGLEHKSASTADRQLTFACGHIPYLYWRDTVAMDRSFWRYVSNHVQTLSSASTNIPGR